MQTALVVDYASSQTSKPSQRLRSLDVFRGLVILAMLVVNNLGDNASTGYFWKHADWAAPRWRDAWSTWCRSVVEDATLNDELAGSYKKSLLVAYWRLFGSGSLLDQFHEFESQQRVRNVEAQIRIAGDPWRRIPLFTHCTLADYVMPWFMLIIGVAIPFSVASSIAKGISAKQMWLRTIRRAVMLVALGWILCFFRDQFPVWISSQSQRTFTFGMDVLQLLGMSYLVARILYECSAKPRAAVAMMLFVWHWG